MSCHVPDPGARETVFFDDFASGDLDRDAWNVRTTGTVVNDELQAYTDSPDTLYVTPEASSTSGGHALAIHPRHRPGHETADGRRFDFVSGRIDTRDRIDVGYGTASARIKLPTGAGVWPAFWMMGYGGWPETGEIDVMECVGESDWTSAGLHGPGYCGEGGLVNVRYFESSEGADDWHVFAVDRRPDELVFTVDGALVFRVTRPMVEFFGSWEFDDDKFLILNVALGGTYPYKTNGITDPCYGLAAGSVDAIADDRVRMLVDWIHVTTDVTTV